MGCRTVYPSPRPSFRVPFGTGATIGKLTEENSQTLLTYDFQAFMDLSCFFSMPESIYHCRPQDLNQCYKLLPRSLKLFIGENEWTGKMEEIKNNTSGWQSFTKRFFSWFNMFKVVKFLNFVHLEIFEKRPVNVSALELLKNIDITFESKDPVELLLYYRGMEKTAFNKKDP